MARRSSKTSAKRDVNQVAADMLRAVTGDFSQLTPRGTRNPAAAALERLGSPKGRKATAKKRTSAKRAQGAKKASR